MNSIGLISADEVAYAGGLYVGDNKEYYLYTGTSYSTISPSSFTDNFAFMLYVASGKLFSTQTNLSEPKGVRPVINLRADTLFKEGTTGTADNPYVVI